MDCLLGIDIGTTGTKCALFTCDGCLVDSEYISYPLTYPREGRAEQNPEDWWNALVGTVRAVVSINREECDVIAISLSTQGGCLILLDENFNPICNAVSWLDRRAREVSELLEKEISVDELYRTCGWPNTNSLNFPTAFWYKEKRPDLFKKARYFASTVDYMNYRLTGTFSIDYTNLALTEFLDIKKRGWSDKALRIAGISRDSVPEIIPSARIIGTLRRDVAAELGLPESVVLVSGAHDQYCANIGAGAVKAGDCVLSTGTAWAQTLTSDTLLFDENRIIHPCIHVLEDKYGLMTAVASGGNSLNWFQNTFQPEVSFEALSREAEGVDAGCEGLIFIPQNISWNESGAFLNLDTVHNIRHFTRSIFEGVAFSNRRHLETFFENGITINTLIMIGGGARSSVWPRIVADISNIPIVIQEQTEAACAGAAILAGVGAGVFTSIEEASEKFGGGKKHIIPIEKNVKIYDKMYRDFVRYLEILFKNGSSGK